MLGRHHIQISLGSTFLLLAPWLLSETIAVISIMCGVLIGSLLPDTDGSDSKIRYMNGIAGAFGMIMDPIIKPLTRFSYFLLKIPFDESHRGSLHSVIGILIYTLFFGVVIAILAVIFHFLNIFLLFFIVGLFGGGLLHLFEDCCTKSGVKPFTPYSQRKFSGNISTTDFRDSRPDKFTQYLFVATIGIVIYQQMYGTSLIQVAMLSTILFVISWVVFYLIVVRM